MKHLKLYESFDDDGKKIIEITTSNPEQLVKILECIKAVGNTGHGFEILVDSDSWGDDGGIDRYKTKKNRTFYWDGDGSDHIDDIKIK